jgi:membrane protein implicated in regulation of membrane protease activity
MNEFINSPWLLVSVIFISLEIFSTRRILFFLGIACLGVALVSVILEIREFESQFKVFVAFSIFSLGVLRFMTRNISPITIIETTLKKDSKLYGQYGVVAETLVVGKKGRVKIGKRVFLAKSREKTDIAMGVEIRITGKDKRCFLVERKIIPAPPI